jgi:hypothetical protein
MSILENLMNENPTGADQTRSAAKAVAATANALSDVASSQSPSLGKYGPIANLGAVALIGMMLWYSMRDASASARDDRAQHSSDLKTVVDMVREHQAQNREESVRSTAQITESVKDLTKEIRGQREDYRRRLGIKDPPKTADDK